MYEPKSSLTCQKLPWQRGIYEVIRWVRDHRFYLGSFWLARFMETAGAPDRFSWESQEFWAVKQHYLTIPQRGTVNPWTERKTRGTRWSPWLTYWKGIRWVSVCESFYYVTFAVCICMSCALKSLVGCSSIIPRRNVCIFTRLHKCESVVLHFFCREILLLHNNKSRRSTLLSADIWSTIKPHLHQKVSECVLAFLFILFNIHKCSPVTMFAIKISDVHCFADIGLIIITACQSGFDLQQELAKVSTDTKGLGTKNHCPNAVTQQYGCVEISYIHIWLLLHFHLDFKADIILQHAEGVIWPLCLQNPFHYPKKGLTMK